MKYCILMLSVLIAFNVHCLSSHNRKSDFISEEVVNDYDTNFLFRCLDSIPQKMNNTLQEYVTRGNEKVIKYGIGDRVDSTWVFSPEGFLSVQYEYGNDIPANSVLEKTYYDNGNGNLRGITITKDTLIVIDNQSIHADRLEAYYYSNGVLRSKGYFTNGLMVGHWPLYDSLNYLIEDEICAPIGDLNQYGDSVSYSTIKTFYANGTVKEEKTYFYFAEFDVPKGTWKYYDEKGKLIKTEKYREGKLIKTEMY